VNAEFAIDVLDVRAVVILDDTQVIPFPGFTELCVLLPPGAVIIGNFP
jgi:hypothetical protein